MLAILYSFKVALFHSVGQFIATVECAMAYTLIALHIFDWILYGFLMDVFWVAEEPPMFAVSLYYILDHWFKPGKRQVHHSPVSSQASIPPFSRWQAARLLLFVWAVPDSLATVSGRWPSFEITFDDRLVLCVHPNICYSHHVLLTVFCRMC